MYTVHVETFGPLKGGYCICFAVLLLYCVNCLSTSRNLPQMLAILMMTSHSSRLSWLQLITSWCSLLIRPILLVSLTLVISITSFTDLWCRSCTFFKHWFFCYFYALYIVQFSILSRTKQYLAMSVIMIQILGAFIMFMLLCLSIYIIMLSVFDIWELYDVCVFINTLNHSWLGLDAQRWRKAQVYVYLLYLCMFSTHVYVHVYGYITSHDMYTLYCSTLATHPHWPRQLSFTA